MDKQTVWITKYAITRGIYEMEISSISDDGNTVHGKAWNDTFRGEGKNWCRTREEAVKRADAMRLKRIEDLKKQIAKLEKMKF